MSILGNSVVRVEDPRFLTAGGNYVGDLTLPNAAHAVFIRSTASSGPILSVDLEDARSAPGVLAVLSAHDLNLRPYSADKATGLTRYPLAIDHVHYAGEAVAIVVAETYAQALDAAERAWVDVDARDAVPSITVARADTCLLYTSPSPRDKRQSRMPSSA